MERDGKRERKREKERERELLLGQHGRFDDSPHGSETCGHLWGVGGSESDLKSLQEGATYDGVVSCDDAIPGVALPEAFQDWDQGVEVREHANCHSNSLHDARTMLDDCRVG